MGEVATASAALTTGRASASSVARGRRLPIAVGVAGATWVAAAGVVYRPDGSALPVACPVHALTGLDCPGCGSTRSLGALARLDPVAALDHNVLVPVALVLVAVAWVRWLRGRWTGRPAPELVRGPVAVLTVGLVTVAFAVVRNLDVASWLASGLAPGGS